MNTSSMVIIVFCPFLLLHFLFTMSFDPDDHSIATNSFYHNNDRFHVAKNDIVQKQLAPALYVFGDSCVDNGNNNFLPTIAKANFLPYGIDFNGTPTGRFTNGKTVADYIAILLGLPYPPPYMGLTKKTRNGLITGLTYASGAAGILRETGMRAGKILFFDKQIDLFQRTVQIDVPKEFKSKKELSVYLSKSIFFICIGSNDYGLNYNNHKTNLSKVYTPRAFGEYLTDELSKRLQRLYTFGARKFVVTNLGPAGCSPALINKKGKCDKELNQLVSFYNVRLTEKLKQLQGNLTGFIFVHSDGYKATFDVIHNLAKYGFTDFKNTCCGNGTSLCVPNEKPCMDRDKHVLFDAAHPSQAACALGAERCFYESSICTPINIQQLVQAE